jgi:hypothetical protein
MAKKAAEVVPEVLVGLGIEELQNLILQAQKRLATVSHETKAQRIKDFKSSEFFKGLKNRFKPIKEEMKAIERTASFSAGIVFNLKIKPLDPLALLENSYNVLFESQVTAGKPQGENLTKDQRDLLQNTVEDYVEGMCDDGISVFFPELASQMEAIQEKVDAVIDEFESELKKVNLTAYEVFHT